MHKIKLFNSTMNKIFRIYQFELQPAQERKVSLSNHFWEIQIWGDLIKYENN